MVFRYQRPIFALCYSRCFDASLAQDLAQETFLRAYLRLASLREEARFVPWLKAIALNLCRQEARHRVREAPLATDHEDVTQAPDDTVEAEERRRYVRLALAQLTQGTREAVLLHYMDGLSCREVAGFLGTTEPAVRARLSRGRRQLRSHLLGLLGQTLEREGPGSEFSANLMSRVPYEPDQIAAFGYGTALSAALRHRGERISGAIIDGLSGDAFSGFYSQEARSASVYLRLRNPLASVAAALGYAFDYTYGHSTAEAWASLKEAISEGRPVITPYVIDPEWPRADGGEPLPGTGMPIPGTGTPEWVLVMGVDERLDRVVLHTYAGYRTCRIRAFLRDWAVRWWQPTLEPRPERLLAMHPLFQLGPRRTAPDLPEVLAGAVRQAREAIRDEGPTFFVPPAWDKLWWSDEGPGTSLPAPVPAYRGLAAYRLRIADLLADRDWDALEPGELEELVVAFGCYGWGYFGKAKMSAARFLGEAGAILDRVPRCGWYRGAAMLRGASAKYRAIVALLPEHEASLGLARGSPQGATAQLIRQPERRARAADVLARMLRLEEEGLRLLDATVRCFGDG